MYGLFVLITFPLLDEMNVLDPRKEDEGSDWSLSFCIWSKGRASVGKIDINNIREISSNNHLEKFPKNA